ncbi:hypothetical protein GALMADRAFT_247901 [Galerina marginata CBS 339.88]|uniref:Uncharacterized protein n=1 Tax=Galerina marginata (strain CBS 339.88) TaxID=685588 RepID=A0A067T930_GALM3|nr:hypothetical protein GALMADRAFT_247901 [Galerina marginata CBS 339.88]
MKAAGGGTHGGQDERSFSLSPIELMNSQATISFGINERECQNATHYDNGEM